MVALIECNNLLKRIFREKFCEYQFITRTISASSKQNNYYNSKWKNAFEKILRSRFGETPRVQYPYHKMQKLEPLPIVTNRFIMMYIIINNREDIRS